MHVSGSEENFKYLIHCTCSKVIDGKYKQSVCSSVCYFAVNIPLFFRNCRYPFSEPEPPKAPAPAPHP